MKQFKGLKNDLHQPGIRRTQYLFCGHSQKPIRHCDQYCVRDAELDGRSSTPYTITFWLTFWLRGVIIITLRKTNRKTIPPMIKLIKLDKRMNGVRWFNYRVDISGPQKHIILYNARRRLWDWNGPGAELDTWYTLYCKSPTIVPTWAWDTSADKVRLYLTDDVLTQFLLIKDQLENINENL